MKLLCCRVLQSLEGLNAFYKRGQFAGQASKYRKGACKNCGAMTHDEKTCVDRPRKVGAWKTNSDIKPDEVRHIPCAAQLCMLPFNSQSPHVACWKACFVDFLVGRKGCVLSVVPHRPLLPPRSGIMSCVFEWFVCRSVSHSWCIFDEVAHDSQSA